MRTCVVVLDVATCTVLYRTGDNRPASIRDEPAFRWQELDKNGARRVAALMGQRFGTVLDYRPVNVKGRRIALALVDGVARPRTAS